MLNRLTPSPILRPLSVAALVFTAVATTACNRSLTRAGQITEDNFEEVAPAGETRAARVGDYYLRNDEVTFVIQRPGRELSLGPYGGTVVDIARRDGRDHFGELIPVIALSRTIHIEELRLISDGSNGSDAVLEGIGRDEANIYYNLRGILPGFIDYDPDAGSLLTYDPDASMGLRIRVRYTLPKDEARLQIEYVFENQTDERVGVPFGLLLDTRGSIETFNSGLGFEANLSKSLNPDDISDLLALADTIEQTVMIHDDSSVGVLPRRVTTNDPPRVIGFTVPTVGSGLILEARTLLGAANEPAFSIAPGETGDIVIDLIVEDSAAAVLERGWGLLGTELAAVSGCVSEDGGGALEKIRVGFNHLTLGVTSSFTTDERGCFAGRVPPGDYLVNAGAPYREPSAEFNFTAPGTIDLSIPAQGTLALAVDIYNELAATQPSEHPCRLTLIGEPGVQSHPALYDRQIDDPGPPVHRQWHLRTCRESVQVQPGRYLAYVTRGPEFTRIETLLDVSAAETTALRGDVHRVVDSTGYAASDFHVHSIYSSDSAVPAHRRVLSLATEAMDFWASLEHDHVVDYTDHIAELGLENELQTVPGSEVTTFDTGHFGAYPLDVVAEQANGGTPDWAPTLEKRRPTMQELFDDIHERGALIQVNHPRGGSGISLNNYFSRMGMQYEAGTLEPYSDELMREIDNTYLRYPEGLDIFSTDFDIIEVINGIGTYVDNGMVYERDAERVGHDWLNLLSSGRRIVGVANSDTHSLDDPPGNPRTMVGGHDGTTASLMNALAAGDAIMTTGPMLRATLVDADGTRAGLGEVLTPSSNTITLRIHAESPDWYQINAVDVLANTVVDPIPNEERAPAFIEPFFLPPTPAPRPNGGRAWVGSVDVLIDLTEAPFDGRDSWVVVRAGGTQSNLYPVMFSGGGVVNPGEDTPEEFFTSRSGKRAWAMTNPIFIDLDGDGLWRGNP